MTKPKAFWIQVTSPYYCAGADFEGGVCTGAAPIIGWMVGKEYDYIYRYLTKKGFKVRAFESTPQRFPEK